jgi:hypothetical protein
MHVSLKKKIWQKLMKWNFKRGAKVLSYAYITQIRIARQYPYDEKKIE